MELKKGYKQTEVGVIPEDWALKKLGEVADIQGGGTPSTIVSQYWNGNIDWFTPSEIGENKYLIHSKRRITEAGLNNSSTTILPIGTILLTTRAGIGDLGILTKEACTNQGFQSLIVNSINYNEFIYYALKNSKGLLNRKASGSTFQEISPNNLKSIDLLIPNSYIEQQAIAEVLSDTDELIQSLNKLIAKKKAIKQGAMQELLTGKKRLQGFTEEWEAKKLGEVADIQKGQLITEAIRVEGNVPVIAGGKKPSYYHNKPNRVGKTITISGSGASAGYVSFHNYPIFASDCSTIIENEKYCIEYFFYFLQSIQTDIYSRQTGGAQPHIHPSDLNPIIFLYPPLQEQQAIAQILSDMDAEIEALEQQLQKTQTLKQGMMQELLTGRIRLVKPATQQEPEPLAIVARESAVSEKETKHKNHNEHIKDAVLIGTMADAFGSQKFPLTRFMYTKVSYLLKRYKEEQDKSYLKKAAGPYKPKTRYGGAEKIALQNKYVKKYISNNNGKRYEDFLAGENVKEAIDYFKKWYGEIALQWIQQFKYTKRDQLELWATVDMAIEDLKAENKPVKVQTIKELINNHKEWRPKLKRPIFSDDNIRTAINKLNQLFGQKQF